MEKETLNSYGWIMIVTLIAAVFIMLASPLANYIGTAITNYGEALMNGAENVEYEEMGEAMEDKFQEEDIRVPLE